MRELDGWGKPVRNEAEASSKLSNGKPAASTGLEEASATPFAAGCPLPQVRINLSDLAIASSYYATVASEFWLSSGASRSCRIAADIYAGPRAQPRRISTGALLGLYTFVTA